MLCSHLGVDTAERTGWVPYPIPPGVSMTTRMHLDREQVAALILHLQSWLDNDSFAGPTPISPAAEGRPVDRSVREQRIRRKKQ